MKLEDGWYVDENNNRWNANKYTKSQAKYYSASLVNCSDCSDCSNCSNCSNCSYCSDCSNCSNCSYCSYCSRCSRCSGCSGCSYCSYCSDCSDCYNCSDCSYCFDCSGCSHCSGCSRCSGCSDFNADPHRFAYKGLGANHQNTCVYWLGDNAQVVCGCFKGDIKEFKRAVLNKYTLRHGYMKFVELAEQLIKSCEEIS